MGWLAGWQYRRQIEIQQAYLDGDLYDFPIYVPIAPNGIGQGMAAKVKDAGADIRFTSSDGETVLDYEIEYFLKSSGNVTARFWVKVPVIASSGSPTKIYLYYGNQNALDAQDPPGTWSNNFAAVYHFGDGTTLSGADSSGQRDLTIVDSYPMDGPVGGGILLASHTGKAYSNSPVHPADLSVSAWVARDGYQHYPAGDWKTSSPAWWEWYLGTRWYGSIRFWVYDASGGAHGIEGGSLISNAWNHIAVTYDSSQGSNAIAKLFHQGNLVHSGPLSNGSIEIPRLADSFQINAGVDRTKTDEVRVATTIRSAAWILSLIHI